MTEWSLGTDRGRPARLGCAILLLATYPGCASALHVVAVAPVEAGVFSHMPDRSFLVVADGGEFASLYRRIHAGRLPPPEIPSIDFRRKVVVVALMGRRSTTGYAIRFDEEATFEEGRATVRLTERTPAPGTVQGAALTAPYAIASLPRGNYETVQFLDAAGAVVASIRLDSTLGRPRPARGTQAAMLQRSFDISTPALRQPDARTQGDHVQH